MIQGKPRFPEVMEFFRIFLTQHRKDNRTRIIFIAHNGSKFDDIILYCNFVQHNLNFDLFLSDVGCYGFLDTLKFLRALFKNCQYKEKPKDASTGRESFALGHCFASFCSNGAALSGAHDALVDAKALFDIFNAECVASKVSTTVMFSHIVPKIKGVKWIKQTAGVAIQAQEETAMKYTMLDQYEAKKTDRPHELRNIPILAPASIGNNTPVRLCLNCMTFVEPDKHRVCAIFGVKALAAEATDETDETDAIDEIDDDVLDREIE
jgi:hypothetical protein